MDNDPFATPRYTHELAEPATGPSSAALRHTKGSGFSETPATAQNAHRSVFLVAIMENRAREV